MIQQIPLNVLHCEGKAGKKNHSEIYLLNQKAGSRREVRSGDVRPNVGGDNFCGSHVTRHVTEILDDLIAQIRRDLERGHFPANVQKRIETITDLVEILYEDRKVGPLSSKDGLSSVAIEELILEITKERKLLQFTGTGKAQGIECKLDFRSQNLLLVEANAYWLRQAVDKFLDNAIEAMADSPVKKLTIVTQFRDNGAYIQIKDTGRGIPSAVQSLLFKEPTKKLQGGRGTGLLLARCIILTYSGKLQLESTGEDGTTMGIWLPLEWLRAAKE